MNIDDYIVYEKEVPARDPTFSDFPETLRDEIKEYLRSVGIERLYSHQVEMFKKATENKNVVITTSTASGKTLAFLLPVLQAILDKPSTRAIFVYPTKALASDQYRAIKPILDFFGEDKIIAGVYDGDTPVNERSVLRKKANIILTNPEMINGSFLPNHNQYGFDFIFKNLKYMIFDELHIYRGAFGSHIANLFRRVNRICMYYNSTPQVLCSSATIANPVELAENIFSKKFVQVDNDGSPACKKKYLLIQPPKYKNGSYTLPTKDLVEPLIYNKINNNKTFIAFCQSRKEVEVIVKEVRENLKNEHYNGIDKSNLISGYRGGYLAKERKAIEEKIINGEILGLVSTNALELGIDIGKIGTAILNGFPDTRASFWQQAGRAGRKGDGAEIYLVLKQKPFDQYIAVDSDWLFNKKSENAVVDKDNLFIQLAHCRSACAELSLTLDDLMVFPNLSEILPILIKNNEIKSENGRFVWIGHSFPCGDYSLRNMDIARYKVINTTNSQVITEADETQVFLQLYKGAIYMHDGITYEVTELNIKDKTVLIKEIDCNYYTDPWVQVSINELGCLSHKEYGRANCSFSDVKVDTIIQSFKRVQFHNQENLGFVQLDKPLIISLETEGFLLQLPENVAGNLYGKKEQVELDTSFKKDEIMSLAFALATSAQMVTMTSTNDIGAGSMIIDGKVFICIYDNYTGGLGFAEKIYELNNQVIENALKMVSGCKCKNGCPACIGTNYPYKNIVIWALKNLLKETKLPEREQLERETRKIINKEFIFSNLSEEWMKFKSFIVAKGEYLSSFISSIDNVETNDKTLTMYVRNNFSKIWAEEEINLKQIMNTLRSYVETPVGFELKIISNESKNIEVSQKIEKRFGELRRNKDE